MLTYVYVILWNSLLIMHTAADRLLYLTIFHFCIGICQLSKISELLWREQNLWNSLKQVVDFNVKQIKDSSRFFLHNLTNVLKQVAVVLGIEVADSTEYKLHIETYTSFSYINPVHRNNYVNFKFKFCMSKDSLSVNDIHTLVLITLK